MAENELNITALNPSCWYILSVSLSQEKISLPSHVISDGCAPGDENESATNSVRLQWANILSTCSEQTRSLSGAVHEELLHDSLEDNDELLIDCDELDTEELDFELAEIDSEELDFELELLDDCDTELALDELIDDLLLWDELELDTDDDENDDPYLIEYEVEEMDCLLRG